jgi:hypothetical protein
MWHHVKKLWMWAYDYVSNRPEPRARSIVIIPSLSLLVEVRLAPPKLAAVNRSSMHAPKQTTVTRLITIATAETEKIIGFLNRASQGESEM